MRHRRDCIDDVAVRKDAMKGRLRLVVYYYYLYNIFISSLQPFTALPSRRVNLYECNVRASLLKCLFFHLI